MTEGKRIAFYARASSNPQERSLGSQRYDLRGHASREGLVVVEEVEDLDEKRHDLTRPGLDRLRDLADAGEIEEVWAWEWARYGEFPVPEVLAVELREFGVELRSLDDNGGGEDGEDMQVIKSLFSRREQRDRVRRTNRGRRAKALRGEVFGGFRARYGLRFVRANKVVNGRQSAQEVSVGYKVDPEQMAVVRRVFETIADGGSLKGLRKEFESEGIPNPSGGPRWSTTTLRQVVVDDVFRPRTRVEVEAMLSPEAAAGLAEWDAYGVHWSGRKRSRFKSSRGKKRTVYETPREEWVPVPVNLTGSGLDRAVVDRARARVSENLPSAKVGSRSWELSGGVLKCGDCGRNMISYRRATSAGRYLHYYRCRPGSRMDVEACPNRRSHPADDLEHQAASMFETNASSGRLLELFDRAVEEQAGGQANARRASTERRAALAEKLSALELERKGYLRQNARGVLSDGELDHMLADVDDQSEGISQEMRAAQDEAEAAKRIEVARHSLLSADWAEDPDAVQPGEYLTLAASPEEVRAAYTRLGAKFTVDAKGELRLRLEMPLDNSLHMTITCS